MADICLSPVLGLRCLGLSHIQEAVTLVPICLELIFSLGLVIAGRNAGRIRYLLAAEGPILLLLAVLSFLSHVDSVFQNNLTPFEALDITIGATSFLPILLYTTFLYFFNVKEFFPRLPMRFMHVAKVFLIAVIPIIIVTNEIGSFIGIKYGRGPDVHDVSAYHMVDALEFARVLLDSTSLALMTVAQGLTFMLFFMGLTSGLVKQHHIESCAAAEHEGVLFRGLGWLAVGMKLSMLETAFGFISPSFGLIFFRRGIRLIGRACIIIGVVKGPESREEFIILDTENGRGLLSGTRRLRVSGLRLHISSPTLIETTMAHRLSLMTILRPSPRSSPDPVPRLSASRRTSVVPPSPLNPSTRTPRAARKSRPPPLVISPPTSDEHHVTVIQGLGRAPTLVLRLSSTALPSGSAIAAMSEHMQSVPVSGELPPPLTDAAPLTEPLPRIDLQPPPENIASLETGSDKGRRRSSAVTMPHRHRRRLIASVGSEALQSRELSRSMPSSPRATNTLMPAFALTVPHRAPPSEDRGSALQQPDVSDHSAVSGISTEWNSSDASSREAHVNIKTVDSGQPQVTSGPNQTRDLSVRTSIVLERLSEIVSPPPPPTPELTGGLVRKDSGVLGRDDLVRMRRAKSVY